MEGCTHEHAQSGPVRTDLHCHACSKGFVAELDFDIDGEHVVECPHCGHYHYRRIERGRITEARWSSDNRPPSDEAIRCRRVWKHDVLRMQTSSASAFIRNRWLNFGRG